MNQPDTPGAPMPAPTTHPQAAAHTTFPANEVEIFRAEDRTAARHIVVLMLTIFVMGVAGYLAIALWASGSA